MKMFTAILSVIAAIAVFVAGHLYWEYKTDPSRFKPASREVKAVKAKAEPAAGKKHEANKTDKPASSLADYTKNWPKKPGRILKPRFPKSVPTKLRLSVRMRWGRIRTAVCRS